MDNKNGRCDSTGNSGNSTGTYCYFDATDFFTYGLTFFSDRRCKHYKVLNENVFCPLSNLRSQSSPTIIGNSLPQYEANLPSYLFEEARIHMKKERGNETLDILIKNYEENINEVNDSNYHTSLKISSIIEKKIGKYQIESNDDKRQIFEKVDELLIEMQNAIDVKLWAKIAPEPDMKGVEQKVIQCVREIVKDPEVLDLMDKTKGLRIKLNSSVHKIQNKSSMISKDIESQRYNVVAECCPFSYKSICSSFKSRFTKSN